ncbi:extensin-like isoform X1 [Vespula maculifrons]|uniref:Extensin-like isoform X1 n=1 Tax=Vespula maculifrons TaxID=7453 RepID=A0ABD2CBK1_VESMC
MCETQSEKRNVDPKHTGLNPGNEPVLIAESGGMNPASGPPLPPPPPPQAPWQSHHIRAPWGRPPPIPREEHHALCPPNLPPTNMPPPQIRPRGHLEGNRSPIQNTVMDHPLNIEYNQIPPHAAKPPPYNSHPLMQSICNPPPPPPPHQQQRPQHPAQTMPPHYQVPISQAYQPPAPCPPWMN